MPRLARLVPFVIAAGLVTGCAQTVAVDPAPDATNAACADVIVRLPDAIGSDSTVLQGRDTNAQSTAAWGDPVAVLLRCGVPVPPPSTDQCVTVGTSEVDWLLSRQEGSLYVYTTYGRDPAVEVVIDNDLTTGITALEAVSLAVSSIPADRGCTDYDEAEIVDPDSDD